MGGPKERLKRLKREIAELRRANDILKAAAHFFGARPTGLGGIVVDRSPTTGGRGGTYDTGTGLASASCVTSVLALAT